MRSLADAFVFAVAYIALRQAGNDEDDDVTALETIATKLASGSEAEINAVHQAANRALIEEREGMARDEVVNLYSDFLHQLYDTE